MFTPRFLLPATILLLTGAFWVEGQTRTRRGNPPRLPMPVAPGMPAGASQEPLSEPTRLQVEFFQVGCAMHDLPGIRVEELGKDNPPAEELLKRLAAFGDASLQVRISNVFDLSRASNLTQGTRVPVMGAGGKGCDGKPAPSVTYEQVGASIRLQGGWDQERKPETAHISGSIQLSSVGTTSTDAAAGLRLPEFREFRIEQEMDLENGTPVLLIANSQASPVTSAPADRENTRCAVMVVRITAWKLWVDRKSE